jgi:transcriptional regulator NrdR family protein
MDDKCKHKKTSCIDTRVHKDGYRVRRHKCKTCNYRFSSVEVNVGEFSRDDKITPLDVLKKNLKIDEAELKRKWLNEMLKQIEGGGT